MGKVKVALSLLTVILTIGLGVYFISIGDSRVNSSPISFKVFGVVALIYGAFRIIRIYQQYKSGDYEN
jgi:hypothetical protein